MTNQAAIKQGIAEFLYPLFWEYDPETLDVGQHADTIMARIMERGGWAAMGWLRQVYSQEQLTAFLTRRGKQVLPPRELNYWALICEIPAAQRRQWIQHLKKRTHVWEARYAHGNLD